MPADRRRIGSRNRAKGNEYERKIIHQICEYFGFTYGVEMGRTPMSGAFRMVSRADVFIAERAREEFPYFLECKKRAGWSLDMLGKEIKTYPFHAWYKEAEEKRLAQNWKYPTLVVFSKSFSPDYFFCPVSYLPANFGVWGDMAEVSFITHLTLDKTVFCIGLFQEFLAALPKK
jgi:hypothetical protein